MPELPDIVILARSMNQGLVNRAIVDAVVNQPKCLNTSPRSFHRAVKGRTFTSCHQRGKWVLAELDDKWTLAFNLGMGGEIHLHHSIEIHDPKRERIMFYLDNGDQLWVHFWWFGHVHLVPKDDFSNHRQLKELGPEPLADDFTQEKLTSMFKSRRGRIKSYLLDQRFIAGIGNVYVQDILFKAKLHPDRKLNTLTIQEVTSLYASMRKTLLKSIEKGGLAYERDFYGNRGRFSEGDFLVAYKTGKPCPQCSTPVEKIRIGSTASYIYPLCQK